MASTQHKPATQDTPTATPVAEARARALQEEIRTLREQARLAGERLMDAGEQDRARVQLEWERAERACREAEGSMARLRAQALAAGDPEGLDTDHRTGTQAGPRATSAPQIMDLDHGWDRHHAAAGAINLLQLASEPMPPMGPIVAPGSQEGANAALVASLGFDFGPMVEEPESKRPAPPAQEEHREQDAPRQPTAPRPAAVSRPPVRSAPQPVTRQPGATTVAGHRAAGKTRRRPTSLLLGMALGVLFVLATLAVLLVVNR